MVVVIPLLLIGCGGVGRQLLQHIVSCRGLHYSHGVALRVIGVCDSKHMVLDSDVLSSGFGDEFLLKICELKSGLGSSSSLQELSGSGECLVFSGQEVAKKVLQLASDLGKSSGSSGVALVDCSASSETVTLLAKAVEFGCCVVLANKKPLTCALENYVKLVSQPRYIRHESTVGAGLPIISSVNRLLSSGDTIFRIIGSLSGTLGYVMSEVERGQPFSQVVISAKSLGYTEPDPRDDLSGMDVARKALILARLLGYRIDLESIKIESLYPDEMGLGVMPLEDFLLRGLPELDTQIKKRIDKAASNSNVLRYACLIEDSRCEVGIKEVPRDSALGRLKGSDNVLEIYSRCYRKQPLVIQGAGAGNDTTAAGVLADILDLQDLFRPSTQTTPAYFPAPPPGL